jgi:small subunit ribosomal protein S16
MLKIKLSPMGKKHEPHYRIVVTEAKSKLTGRGADTIGQYHPLSKKLVFDKDLLRKWMEKGAQPTEKIRRLLRI